MFGGRRNHRGNNGREKRRYGYYRCSNCNKAWESAWTFCERSSNKPLYTQDCKSCNIATLPYRTEPIKCSVCGETECVCSREERDARHTDTSKPHRRDLCEKCRSGRPCGGD